MGSVANGLDRIFRGAQELADQMVLDLRMVAEQPGDGVRAVLALGERRVAGLLALGRLDVGGHRLRDREARLRVLLAALELRPGQHALADRVEPPDAGPDLAIGDALDLERMQAAEIGDLVEGQPGIVDQPNRRGFRHERLVHARLLENACRRRVARGVSHARPWQPGLTNRFAYGVKAVSSTGHVVCACRNEPSIERRPPQSGTGTV
jgi:hypothetical protein